MNGAVKAFHDGMLELNDTAKTHYVAPGQPHVWVWKRCSFDAAHQLPLYQGACSRIHGHTYFVELGVLCSIDPATGMGLDLKELGEFLKSNVEALFDHQFINDRIPGQHSTAEGIARYILDVADRYFNKSIVKVRVYETPDSWVEMDSTTGSNR